MKCRLGSGLVPSTALSSRCRVFKACRVLGRYIYKTQLATANLFSSVLNVHTITEIVITVMLADTTLIMTVVDMDTVSSAAKKTTDKPNDRGASLLPCAEMTSEVLLIRTKDLKPRFNAVCLLAKNHENEIIYHIIRVEICGDHNVEVYSISWFDTLCSQTLLERFTPSSLSNKP